MPRAHFLVGRKVSVAQTAPTKITGITGTADSAVVDVGGAFSQATLNNNFADLATQLNAVIDVLKAAGLTT